MIMYYDEHTDLSIYHLTHFPESYDPTEKRVHYPTIFALHGHGSNERDLIGLSESLQENLLWVSGRGPVEFALDAYDWYPVNQFGKPDPVLLNQALERIDNFITELLITYPIDPQKFFLLGFSQGSMISMTYLLTHPWRLAGVIAQSGYIPRENNLLVDEEKVKGKPVIMTHGFEDSRMPLEWSFQTRDLLLKFGVDLEYHNFHMDHAITAESLGVVRSWLNKRI
jgi:phospholipase/carboxylesterase